MNYLSTILNHIKTLSKYDDFIKRYGNTENEKPSINLLTEPGLEPLREKNGMTIQQGMQVLILSENYLTGFDTAQSLVVDLENFKNTDNVSFIKSSNPTPLHLDTNATDLYIFSLSFLVTVF